eukprot:m.11206 g.11206  ORF g.11206 m.11206 type:complete len:383 (-) comp3796_c0_seq1:86-1234(-)
MNDDKGSYLERGAKLIALALDMEKIGEFSLASDNMARGIEILIEGGKDDTNEHRRKHVMSRLLEYLHRLEALKQKLFAQHQKRMAVSQPPLSKPIIPTPPPNWKNNNTVISTSDKCHNNKNSARSHDNNPKIQDLADDFDIAEDVWDEVDTILGKKSLKKVGSGMTGTTTAHASQPQKQQLHPMPPQQPMKPHARPKFFPQLFPKEPIPPSIHSINANPSEPSQTSHKKEEEEEQKEEEATEEEMEAFQNKYLGVDMGDNDNEGGKVGVLGVSVSSSYENDEDRDENTTSTKVKLGTKQGGHLSGNGKEINEDEMEERDINAVLAKSESVSKMARKVLHEQLKDLRKQQEELEAMQKDNKERILDPIYDLIERFNQRSLDHQ